MKNNKTIKQIKKLRTARHAVSVAAQEALEIIKILKRLSEIFENYHQSYLKALKERNLRGFDNKVVIELSNYELGKINGALRDYVTLRIANIVDPHPSVVSLKDFDDIKLEKLRQIPEIKEILDVRDNWIGHINKRFIGPVAKETILGKKILTLLETILFLVCIRV